MQPVQGRQNAVGVATVSERPFMQLYVSDFVGDTLLLSAEHIGVYLLLLIALWNAHGTLPMDDVKLARVARMSVENWRTIWTDLEQFFEVSETSISHGRLSRELLKAVGKSVSRSEAGRKGGKAKALKDKNTGLANAMPLPRHLPEPYRKGRATLSDPTENAVVNVSKHVDGGLFAECVALTEPVKSFIEHKTFAADVVTQAKANIVARRTAA